MLRFAVLPLMFCGLVAAACSSAQAPANDEADVAAAVKAFQTAMDTGDAPTVMQYIADDALMMEGATIETRMQYEAVHLPADIEFAKGVTTRRTPIGQTVRGDVAWATTSTDFSGTFEDRPVDFRGLETMVLSREPAGWRIRAIHWSAGSRPPGS